jgi:hypothetical protein
MIGQRVVAPTKFNWRRNCMAILCGIGESGMDLYEIPDADLSRFQVTSRPLDEESRAKLFPGKDQPTKDDAQGMIPVAAAGGDVQAFGTDDICYVYDADGDVIWWPC